jgi:4-hydroxythreonine-4-phosphate dehydrogenase
MALVTAPIDKDLAMREGLPVPGHTEYLAQRCPGATPLMVMVGATMRVALLTTHWPLRQVAEQVTCPRVVSAAQILVRGLGTWFGIHRPRIAVLGLNPHAGEGGRLGLEERDHIEPAIRELRAIHSDGAEFHGPLPADSAFVRLQRGEFDAALAMYHDQGLGPFKLAHFHDGVNATFGLPFVRTSPDHGTAVGLEGRGIADPTSLFAAIRLAREAVSG